MKSRKPDSKPETRNPKLETGSTLETGFDPEIARLKKELEDKERIIGKTDAGLKALCRDLEKANTSLEAKVQQRTEELRKANKALNKKLAEHLRLEEALREEEERYHQLAEHMTDILWTMDANQRFTYINPSMQALMGHSVAEPSQLTLEEIVPPAALETVTEAIATTLADEDLEQEGPSRPGGLELELYHKDGSLIWTESRITALRNPGGQPVGILGVTRDITERKRAEANLSRLNDVLRGIRKVNQLITSCNDREELMQSVCDSLVESHGYKRAWIVLTDAGCEAAIATQAPFDHDFLPLMDALKRGKPPPCIQRCVEHPALVMQTNPAVECSGCLVSKCTDRSRMLTRLEYDGQFYGFLNVLLPEAMDADKEERAVFVEIGGDIAFALRGIDRDKERIQTERALRISEANLHRVIKENADGIIIADENGGVLFVNRAVEALFNRHKEELIGEVFGFPLVAGEATVLDIIRKGEKPAAAEMRVVSTEWEGEPAYIASLHDITERKQVEETLRHHFISLAETMSGVFSLRNPFAGEHQSATASLVRAVGEKMGFDNEQVESLYIGTLLHDIGKVSIPESILRKPGKLSEEESALVRTHPQRGHSILRDANLPWPVEEMALHHHERLDGSGYPDGLEADGLALEVRLLAVCNVVDAMSRLCPYRPARSKEDIVEEITSGRGTKYDPDVVDVLLDMIESGELELPGNRQ